MPKYIGREKYINNEDQYSEMLEGRDVSNIEHFLTFIIGEKYNTNYSSRDYVWKKGDKLYKLAYRFYGDLQYWWVIALWNNKPTDAHYSVGDVIEIPLLPEEIYADIVS